MSLVTFGTVSHPVELVSVAADLLRGAQLLGAERIPSLLAEFGVFTPQFTLERHLRASEEALGAEQVAHVNTLEQLQRIEQLLAAERRVHLNLQAENQRLRAMGGEACFDVPRTTPVWAAQGEPVENADTNDA